MKNFSLLHSRVGSLAQRLMVLFCVLMLGVTQALCGTYTYDFSTVTNKWYTNSTHTTQASTGNANNYTTIYYTDGTTWTASGTSHYFNSGYYLLGKSGAYLQLPTFSGEKITKVKLHGSNSHSESVSVNIYAGNNAASTAQTWSTQGKDHEYSISSSYQSSSLRVQVTNKYNTQFTQIIITTVDACSAPTSPTNSSITSTGFTAGWTAPSSAPGSGYLVAYATATSTTPGDNITASSGNYTVAAVTSGTSKIYTGLTPGTTYHWWVRSKCSSTDLSGWVAGPDITIPKITASATITGLDYNENEGPSTAKTFTVSGSGLTGNLTVTAPTNFEVCKTQNGTYTSSVSLTASGSSSYNKSVSSTTIYVRLASGKTEGTYGPSNVTISGGSANSNTSVSVKGIVSAACTATPTVGVVSLNGSFF